ncbi:TetR/AcrR family transcriptional regulator [Promicromonospora soli]
METREPTRPGPRRTVTDQDLVDAALQLLDRGGPDALSVRALAAEVGLTATAVYTYFPTKDAVVAAATDGLLGRAPIADLADRRRPGRDRVIGFALGLRRLLLDHPGAVPLLLRSGFNGPHALAVGEGLLVALADAGLTPDDAARASYLLTTHLLGTVALDVAEPGGADAGGDDARTAVRRAVLENLPGAAFPRTVEAAPVIAGYNSTAQYRWGLERLVDAVGPAGA